MNSYTMPNDFFAFWQKQLEKIREIDLKYTITKTEFSHFENIEFYDLYFDSFDGSRIYAKYIKPKSDKKVGLIFHFHGYPGCSRNWLEKTAFSSCGYAVLAMDLRGQGGKSNDSSITLGTSVAGHIVAGVDDCIENMMYYKHILDMCVLVKIGKQLEGIDDSNLISLGHSQGGAFAISCAALNPEISKTISLYPFLSDFKKVYDLDKDEIAYEGIRYYSRWYNINEENSEYFFNRLSYFDTMYFAKYVKSKVLFGASKVDIACPYETQIAVYNNLECDKKLITYLGFGHENIPDFNEQSMKFIMED